MNVTVSSTGAVSPVEWNIGKENEHNARSLVFSIPLTMGGLDLTSFNIRVEMKIGTTAYYSAALTQTVGETISVTYPIDNTLTSEKGRHTVQIVAYNDAGTVWKSDLLSVIVDESVNADATLPEYTAHTYDEIAALMAEFPFAPPMTQEEYDAAVLAEEIDADKYYLVG